MCRCDLTVSLPALTPTKLQNACRVSIGLRADALARLLFLGIVFILASASAADDRLVELTESTWCCGSAGIYNLIQPGMAQQLLDRKLGYIKKTGARIVATANPGCLLQLINGARQQGLELRLAHPITLLAEAYRRGDEG